MDADTIRTPLTQKEGEALMWGLAQIGDYLDRVPTELSDPLTILLAEGWQRPAISFACDKLFEVAYGDFLAGEFTSLEKSILRCCIEQTTWIGAYELQSVSQGEARKVLRDLAIKLEPFGIIINHIPNN